AASQLLGLALGAAHRRPAPQGQADCGGQGQRISGDDERPGVHAAAIRFSRASIFVRARSARIRISTTEPNSSEKPSAEASKGQSMTLDIVELPRRKLMLSPWCRVFHHTTEKRMIGILIAPTRPKMAVIRPSPPFSFSADARAMKPM